VVRVVREVYERYGYEPLETPAFENIETLVGKYGEEGSKLIFKILRRGEHEATGEADLALRYDLTVPLARVVAEYQARLPKFFKRYQVQPVWRADRPARGRFREFHQCDIDAIGSTSPVVEAELIGAAAEVLTTLGFSDFVVRLNHRRVLGALLGAAGVPEPRHGDALVALDKLDKLGADGVAREFAARGIDGDVASRCLSMFAEHAAGSPHDAVARLGQVLGSHEALGELATIVALCESTPGAGHVRVDPSLARGLSYYTGAIMEMAVPDLAGSLGGGGRYDNLIGMFLGRDVPACGFSLGLERLLVVMTERDMFPPAMAQGAVDVMITCWNDQARGETLLLASEWRRAGLRVDVYPDPDKLGRQFKYASARHVPLVAILGDDERADRQVALKDMRSGAQQTVSRGDAVAFIRKTVNHG
jgi:histidyl-tRNA synthetase